MAIDSHSWDKFGTVANKKPQKTTTKHKKCDCRKSPYLLSYFVVVCCGQLCETRFVIIGSRVWTREKERLGGGMMLQEHLFYKIRGKVRDQLSDYVQAEEIIEKIDDYIVPPKLGNQAGILGGIALAEQALEGD